MKNELGQYHIPLTAEACANMLARGVPCEIPLTHLPLVLQYIYYNSECRQLIMIEMRDCKAYLTPEAK